MDRPAACLVTSQSAGGPFLHIARWLGRGFSDLGLVLDVVLPEGPAGVRLEAEVRYVRLGSGRASRSVAALRRYFRDAAPPLALVMPGYIAPFALFGGRGTAVPVVPWEAGFAGREAAELSPRMRLLAPLQRLTYRRAPRIAAVSRSVAEFVGEFADRDDVVVIPVPVDVREIRDGARPPAQRSSELVVCGLGKLTPYKGYDVLLDALVRASPMLGGWTLQLIGDGPARAALAARADELGIGDRVVLHGSVDNAYPMLAAADVFVQPSRFEGFGVAIVEALALGVPVVATASGGPQEILDEGRFGILVPPGDVGSLADALISAATDAGLRDRLRARAGEAVRRYAPVEVARHVLQLRDEFRVR